MNIIVFTDMCLRPGQIIENNKYHNGNLGESESEFSLIQFFVQPKITT